jgi:hypothetical protein
MAARKMTFSLPEDLAVRLLKRVPARERSRFLALALEKKLKEEEAALVRSCRLANEDADASSVEAEWDQINDPIEEPWVGPSREPAAR